LQSDSNYLKIHTLCSKQWFHRMFRMRRQPFRFALHGIFCGILCRIERLKDCQRDIGIALLQVFYGTFNTHDAVVDKTWKSYYRNVVAVFTFSKRYQDTALGNYSYSHTNFLLQSPSLSPILVIGSRVGFVLQQCNVKSTILSLATMKRWAKMFFRFFVNGRKFAQRWFVSQYLFFALTNTMPCW